MSLWGHMLRWSFYGGNIKLDSFCTIALESFWLDNSFQPGSEKNLVSLPQLPHPYAVSDIHPFRVPLPHLPAHSIVNASVTTGTPCPACSSAGCCPVTSIILSRLSSSQMPRPWASIHLSLSNPALRSSKPRCPAIGSWVFRTEQPVASPLGHPSVFPLTALPLFLLVMTFQCACQKAAPMGMFQQGGHQPLLVILFPTLPLYSATVC